MTHLVHCLPNYKDTRIVPGLDVEKKLTQTLILCLVEKALVFVVPKIGERGRAPLAPPPVYKGQGGRMSVFMV